MDYKRLAATAWNIQEGLTAHFIQHVWDVFNNTYRDKWIGTAEEFALYLSSRDINT
jgi:hypothetical protein